MRFVRRPARPALTIQTLQPLWVPPPDWAGQTVVVVGTGPSFTASQARDIGISRARDRIRVLAINDAVYPCWYADMVFAADRRWWVERRNVPGFDGLRVALGASYPDAPKQVRLIGRAGAEGCQTKPGSVYTHGHSGAMAIQLAAQMGAAKIALVGFDMRDDGKRHFFGAYDQPLGTKPNMGVWLQKFQTIADAMPGRIVNATPGSALDCVPLIELQAAL